MVEMGVRGEKRGAMGMVGDGPGEEGLAVEGALEVVVEDLGAALGVEADMAGGGKWVFDFQSTFEHGKRGVLCRKEVWEKGRLCCLAGYLVQSIGTQMSPS